ncbi:wax ester/triacylglycerol synthase family O-acyltransferase [Patulibacter defluvii]|uniref:wax ester/triacylglycerol synthase family O-acyltransferase n=1 Tax=Patulibacter defluvii TaxID=3095358 RepID=UPI002A7501CB|nr:wax ester/triacylglycerol synthase family O-acyltransferase [Patulibacter sp. DM4]
MSTTSIWQSGDLTPIEAVMWRAEADPALSSTVVALEILDRCPEWERLSAAHEWGSRMVPRFRERVVEGPLGLAGPTWAPDPDFDLGRHLHRTALAPGEDWPALLERVARIAQAPFDRTRPPWEAVLVDGLPDGRAAYVLKLHHATLDGAAGMQLLGGLHSRRRAPTPDKPRPHDPAGPRPGPLAVRLRRDARDLARVARGLPRVVRRPLTAALDAAGYARSLRRVLGAARSTPSPLLAARDGHWCFHAIDVPLDGLRAAARSAGATLNDAFLAALLGGFARYHDALGSPRSALPIAIPISIRRPDDPAGGNRFAAARIDGPLGPADPVARMRAIGEAVRGVRDERALDAVGALAPVLARLPAPLLSRLVAQVAGASDLQASNVPGIRETVYLAGARVERLYGFGPLPGCAAMILLVSHGDSCCVSVNHDRAAITDPERFLDALAAGFDELLALAPGAVPATATVRR